jgi:hypothetical protein
MKASANVKSVSLVPGRDMFPPHIDETHCTIPQFFFFQDARTFLGLEDVDVPCGTSYCSSYSHSH